MFNSSVWRFLILYFREILLLIFGTMKSFYFVKTGVIYAIRAFLGTLDFLGFMNGYDIACFFFGYLDPAWSKYDHV